MLAIVGLIIVADLFNFIESIFSSLANFVSYLKRTAQALPTILEIILPISVLLATVITFNGFNRTS